MRVTYLGHAGLKIETGDATVLVDPWFSPEGTFQASWFQYPDNHHLVNPSLFKPNAIVISHEHLDHVDPWFLSQVPSDVPVFIPKYPSAVLREKVESAGTREINEIPEWEQAEVAKGIEVFFVREISPMNHDSAIVIRADGQTFLNMNDSRLVPVQVHGIKAKVGGTIDLFALQGSGASWHPMCYHYPEEEKKRISRQKRTGKFNYIARMIRIVEPRQVMPFAGPPCLLDEEIFQHNSEIEDGYFPDQFQVSEWLASVGINNSVILLPGDAWDIETQVKDSDSTWEGFRSQDMWEYLSDYAQRRRPFITRVLERYPTPTDSQWPAFKEYFGKLLTMSPYFNEKIGMRVGFDVTGSGGGQWSVDFSNGTKGLREGIKDCGYIYRFDSRWLPPLLSGTLHWEDFFLSLRFQAWRDPDLYSEHLLGVLKFADPIALKAVEDYETTLDTEERFTLHAEGKTYSVQRYCPHSGNDLLETGELMPGRVLRCLAHYYEFSLDTGECLNGVCPMIQTTSL